MMSFQLLAKYRQQFSGETTQGEQTCTETDQCYNRVYKTYCWVWQRENFEYQSIL